MLENIEAVIFDLDGTLVDSMWMWGAIDVEYLAKYDYQLPSDLEDHIAGMSFSETANYFKERFGLPDSIEDIKQEWVEMARYKYINEAMLKPGVLNMLDHLKEHNIKTGIASSNSKELVQEVLSARGIEAAFSVVRTSCEVASGKPSPDIYLLVAKELGVNPDQCLVFEDIPMGIIAGKQAGMKTCAIWDEFSVHQELEKRQLADYYIKSFDEVIAKTYEVL